MTFILLLRRCFAELDGFDRVLHIGSFSKTLSAAARVGYIAGRRDWIDGLTDLKLATSFGGNAMSPQIVHALLTDGTYRRHVDSLRAKLADAMTLTASRLKAEGLTLWTEPQGGMFLWAKLPDGLDSGQVARHALEKVCFWHRATSSVPRARQAPSCASTSRSRWNHTSLRCSATQCGTPAAKPTAENPSALALSHRKQFQPKEAQSSRRLRLYSCDMSLEETSRIASSVWRRMT